MSEKERKVVDVPISLHEYYRISKLAPVLKDFFKNEGARTRAQWATFFEQHKIKT